MVEHHLLESLNGRIKVKKLQGSIKKPSFINLYLYGFFVMTSNDVTMELMSQKVNTECKHHKNEWLLQHSFSSPEEAAGENPKGVIATPGAN